MLFVYAQITELKLPPSAVGFGGIRVFRFYLGYVVEKKLGFGVLYKTRFLHIREIHMCYWLNSTIRPLLKV